MNLPSNLVTSPLFTGFKRYLVASSNDTPKTFVIFEASTMLPLAWQETGYPEKYYYSEFCYDDLGKKDGDRSNELKFLSIYSPNEISNSYFQSKQLLFSISLTS